MRDSISIHGKPRWILARILLPSACFLWTFLFSPPSSAAIWYVDKDNTSSTQNGASWGTAYRSIQSAVNAAFNVGGGEVWVAEGTYTATTNNVVVMEVGVHLYGGFAGTETARSQRNWTTHITAIDGQNARRGVVGGNTATLTATLDGFTITRGYTTSSGGGMYNLYLSSPTVTNCTFSYNWADYNGGGMYNYSSSPAVTNCRFHGNWASTGGGMYNYSSSSPTVTNCTFHANTSSNGGGGMYNYSSSPAVTNCTFSANSSVTGGGIENYYSSPRVTNCTFHGNSADFFAGMQNGTSSSPRVTNCTFSANWATSALGGAMNGIASVTNCIFWGDLPLEIRGGPVVVIHSIVQGGYAGTNVLNADPLFLDAASGNLRLRAGSPAIDAGTPDGAPAYDIEGTPRPIGSGFDMGAFESPPDADSDGLFDNDEAALGTNPNNPDTDNDGLTDGFEVYSTLTNPLDSDTDNDGDPDGEEVAAGFSPTDPDSFPSLYTWVDFGYVGVEDGGYWNPYNSMTDANNNVPAGGTVLIDPGATSESLTLSYRATYKTTGGTVTIGIAP